jgi:uncharacterized membrane protein
MRLKSFDLWIVVLLSLATMVLTLLDLSNMVVIIRLLIGLPLVLILPGYAITTACFPGVGMGSVERLVFSLGLSLAVVALGGLALNWTPWGIQANSWVVLLGGITLLASAISVYRRQRQPFVPIWQWRLSFNFYQSVLIGLALVVVVSALMVARLGAEENSTSFTQFWMLPNNQKAVSVGLVNLEQKPLKYCLQIKVADVLVWEQPEIELQPGQKWERVADLTIAPNHSGAVQALLYRLDDPDKVYRRATLDL